MGLDVAPVTELSALTPGCWYRVRHYTGSGRRIVTHIARYAGEAYFEMPITRTTSWGAKSARIRTLFVYPAEFISAVEIAPPADR